MNEASDPTRRFSDRVADYVRYRPHYPPAVVAALQAHAGLRPESVVADVGSGTGIFADQLLRAGCRVMGIEPNAEMRAAAEGLLHDRDGFTSVDGTAENTTLPDGSVDLVTAAQAFHWFDPDRTRAEFARILRSDGTVALVWNSRLTDASPFLRDYEVLLRTFGTDYRQVDHLNITLDQLRAFYRSDIRRFDFPNQQVLDYAGLEGRLLSSSYTPAAGDPRRAPMLAELRRIFDRHAESGRVRILYATELHLGRV